jgi:hypothetical protein
MVGLAAWMRVVPKGSASGTKVQFFRVQEPGTLPDRDPDALEADSEPPKEATAPLSGQPAAGSERWVLDLQYQAKYQHAFGDA